MMENDFVTIAIKKKTKERFDQLGNLAMTQDDVLNKLIDIYEKQQKR